jgi:hypothetical protein
MKQLSFLNDEVLLSKELAQKGILDLLHITFKGPEEYYEYNESDIFTKSLEELANTDDNSSIDKYKEIAQQLTLKVESYSQIVGYLCGIYDEKTIKNIKKSNNKECTIGIFIEQLVNHYLTWCIVQDIEIIKPIYDPLLAMRDQRNVFSHTGKFKKPNNEKPTDPKTFNKNRIDCCLTYIVIVNYICQKILEAKNGGIHFKSAFDGRLVVSIDGNTIYNNSAIQRENPYTNKRIYDPRYQVNFNSKLNEGIPIQVSFTPDKGTAFNYDNVITRLPGEFIELEYPDIRNKESRLSITELPGTIVTIYCKKLKVTLKCEGQVIEVLDHENVGVKLPWGKTIRIAVHNVLDPLQKVMENTIYFEMPLEQGLNLLVWDIDKKFNELIKKQ